MATGVGINESGRSFIIRSMMMHFLRAKEFPRRVFLSCHIQEGLNKHSDQWEVFTSLRAKAIRGEVGGGEEGGSTELLAVPQQQSFRHKYKEMSLDRAVAMTKFCLGSNQLTLFRL